MVGVRGKMTWRDRVVDLVVVVDRGGDVAAWGDDVVVVLVREENVTWHNLHVQLISFWESQLYL